jgi:hypothetical protein
MSQLVQVAVASDVTEAELIQSALADAGIESSLETELLGHDPDAHDDPPLKVLVPESQVEIARDVIEDMAESDDEPDV